MASINWEKQTRQRAASLKKHNGQEERLAYNHSNPDIDKSRTNQNYCIGCNDYDDSLDAMIERVAKVDKLYPQQAKKKNGKPSAERKDRKICVSLEVKCPQEIFDSGRSPEFFEKTHGLFQDFFGKENVHGMCVHLDEMHPYIDEDGKERMSLAHSTTLVSGYTEWMDNNGNLRKGISASKLMNPVNIKKLNKAMCDMVRREFGVEYNTGEKAKHKTVEQLKAESEIAVLKKEIAELTEDRDIVKEAGRIAFAEAEENIAKAKNIAVQQLQKIVEQGVALEKQIKEKQATLKDIDEQVLAAVEIPPRPLMPPEPPMPQPPETQYNFTDKNEMRDYKRAWSEYEKAMKDRPKVLKAYEAECERIAEKQAAWDNQFKPVIGAKNAMAKAADKVREAAARERQVQQERQQIQSELERGRAENEKSKRAIQKREQELNLEVERRTQERLEKTDNFQRLMQTSSAWEQRVAALHKSKGSKQQREKTTDEKVKPIASKGDYEK